MSEISSVQLSNVRELQIQTEYLMRVLALKRDVIKEQGEMIVKLIQSASLPEYQGKNLDVKA